MDESIYLQALNRSYQKFLSSLKKELLRYSNEEIIWQTGGNISNSAGNLALHLLGNLNHFIGAQIGNTDYQRNRPLEFSMEFKPRGQIIEEIDETKKMLNSIIPQLSHETLHSDYPEKFGGETWTTHEWLIQCNTHLAYHLGQINYHRRLMLPATPQRGAGRVDG